MTWRRLTTEQPWLPYAAPLFLFLLLTSLEGSLPGGGEATISPWYPAFYALKVALVTAVAVACRATWADLRPWPRPSHVALAVAAGLLVIGLWVGLDGRYPDLPMTGSRQAYNPSVLSAPGRIGFLMIRGFGLILLIPLIEELFWRSFLNRWLIDADFQKLPVGRVTAQSAALTAMAFALAHPEWLPALLTGVIWAGLLHTTGSLSACVISHAVANLALGAYVLATGEWKYL